MHPVFAEFYAGLHALVADLQTAMEGLSQDALDWSPGPDMNSIAVLAAHTAGSLRYWVGDVVGQEPSGRMRESEFRTAAVTAAELSGRLDAALAHSRAVLDRLTLADLEAARVAGRDNRQVTIAWALTHALEHTGTHVGHIQITRQLWDQRAS